MDLVNLTDLPLAFGVEVRTREPAPVTAIGGFEIAIGIGPRVPDFRVLAEVADVVFAGEIPQQLTEHGRPVHFFGRQQGITLREIDRVMRAKPGNRVDARAALLARAPFEDKPHQIQVLFHVGNVAGKAVPGSECPKRNAPSTA